MKNNFCVIMAGGVGSRFWPMSRAAHPKQFIDILGTGKSLLQQTFDRFKRVCPTENILIVTHESYIKLVKTQLPEILDRNILAEPQRRNTAPCVAYACSKILKLNPNANIVVAPSDHIIEKEDEFVQTISNALDFTSKNNSLLTLGIQPDRPDTGYGYIQFVPSESDEVFRTCKVKTFTEKPNIDMAKFFLKSGDFLWNSGIFIWNIRSIFEAFENYLPDVMSLFSEGAEHYNTPAEAEFVRTAYSQVTNISIDYGIMEKAKNVYVVPADIGWSDLGTWGSLYEHHPKNVQQNAIVGQHVLMYDSKNCIVHMPKDKLVVLHGLENYIVVESDNTLLVCKMEDEQMIRQFVNDVKIQKGEKFL